jgi:hypothetical protein
MATRNAALSVGRFSLSPATNESRMQDDGLLADHFFAPTNFRHEVLGGGANG